jgi:hypothetical protein
MKTKSILVLLILNVSCVSTSKNQPEFEETQVLTRVAGLSSTPDWATGLTPYLVEKDDFVTISTITMSGDARPDACTQAAGSIGRTKILRQIKEKISASEQINELSTASDPTLETLMVFLSQGSLTGAKNLANYWEKRIESDASGTRVLRLYCAVKVGIDKKYFQKQISDIIDGTKGGDPEIRQKLKQSHKDYIDSVAVSNKEN